MKKLALLFVSIFTLGVFQAQQLPQLSQFMITDFSVNPAIAGIDDYYQIKTSVRNQWVGIEDAPKTTLLSIYGKSSDNVGLGGAVFNDQVGPTSRAGASLTYAYHFRLANSVKMSMALSGGFTQFKIDKAGCYDLKVVENFNIDDEEVEFSSDECEDTLTLLNKYIEESEFDLDKEVVKDIMKDVYREACEFE